MTPPFRQRFLIALALMTVAGGLIAWGSQPATRLCGLAALAASSLCLVLSVRDLKRHRAHATSYARHFAVAYAPHFVVAIILAVLLRAWIIFAPPTPFPLLVSGGPPLHEQIAADTTRMLALSGDPAADIPVCRAIAQTYQCFYQIDPVADPEGHADAFILSFAALLREAALRSQDPSFPDNRSATRLTAGAAYLPLVRANSAANPLLPQVDRDLRALPARLLRPLRDPLRALRRHALRE